MTNYIAIFLDASDQATGADILAEIDIRDTAGRRAVPSNTTIVHETTNASFNWESGKPTDGSTSTYYGDGTPGNPLVLYFTDGADFKTIQLYRGSDSYPIYAPNGIRVYVSTTNHGTSEASWLPSEKRVDATWASSVAEWTPVYPLTAPTTNVSYFDGASWHLANRSAYDGTSWRQHSTTVF